MLCRGATQDLLAATGYVSSRRDHGLHPRPDALGAWADALEDGGHAHAPELCPQRLEVACRPQDAAPYGVAVAVFLRAVELDRFAACWAQVARDGAFVPACFAEASAAALVRAGRLADAARCRGARPARGRAPQIA